MKHLLKLFVVFGAAIVLAGCATMSAGGRKPAYPTKLTDDMKQAFTTAEQSYHSGSYEEAKRLYQDYIAAYGYNENTDEARFKLGEMAFMVGNYKTAVSYYRDAFQNIYNPAIAPKAQFKAALCLQALDSPNEAYTILESIERRDLSNILALRVDSLAISVATQMGHGRDDRIKWYLFLLDDYAVLSPATYQEKVREPLVSEDVARRKVIDWVQDANVTKGSVDALPLKQMKGKPSGGYALYKLAMVHYSLGEFDEAGEFMRKFLRGYPKHEFASNAGTLLAELKGKTGGKSYKIGVILPLSGKFALYGNSTLHGIQCAAGLTPPCSSPLNVELIVKDSTGDPAIAENEVAELANEGVIGIIGPLLSAMDGPVTKKAQELKIPIISLSQREDAEESGDYIFKHALTSEDQVNTLVDYAVSKRKLKKFGIMYPTNNYGTILAKLFKRRVEAEGGKVVFEKGYTHQDLRVTNSVKEMGSFSSFDGAAGSAVEGMSMKFEVPSGVEALFIPDSYKAVRYVVLAISNDSTNLSPDMLLMGVNRWNNPGLVSHDLGLLEGSVFVDGFFKDSADVTTRTFVQNFTSAFSMEPTILEAQAFDALRMLMTGIKNGGVSRERLKVAIGELKNMVGVTGNISIGSRGNSERRLFILTVRNGAIAELSSAQGIMRAEGKEPFPYSRASQMGSDAKYEGKKLPDMTVRTDSSKYEPLDFYTTELEP